MNETDIKPQFASMLVELDALLDTRLGTIAKFGKEAYVKVLTGDYTTRRSEHFDGIDPVEYRKLYRERDAVTLSLSMITHVVSLVKDFVTRVNITSATSPVKKVPRVDINVYPFDPPDKTMQLIIKALRIHINDKVDIGYVRYTPSDLHYDLVKFTYDHLIMYDMTPWFNAQAEHWLEINHGLPEVTVFFPAMHHGENLSDIPEDITEMADEFANVITPIINPMQLPIQFFCSALDPKMLARGEIDPPVLDNKLDQT